MRAAELDEVECLIDEMRRAETVLGGLLATRKAVTIEQFLAAVDEEIEELAGDWVVTALKMMVERGMVETVLEAGCWRPENGFLRANLLNGLRECDADPQCQSTHDVVSNLIQAEGFPEWGRFIRELPSLRTAYREFVAETPPDEDLLGRIPWRRLSFWE